MEPTTLITEQLILRPFEPADTDAVYAACQDPEIPRWTSVPSPYTREHAVGFVAQTCPDGWRDDRLYNFAVTAKDDGRLVGSMGLVRLELLRAPQRQAELGYWTVKEARGRGYTAQAASAVVRWAFEELGVERLEWLAEAGNNGSRAVALKTGFRRDLWAGSLLPSDLGLPSGKAYLPVADA
jgi:RimJ/RimL family protein N-acetyltransferase